ELWRGTAGRRTIRRRATRGEGGARKADRAVSLPGVSGEPAPRQAERGGAGARPPIVDAGLEPPPRLSGRRVVSRVPQDPLARRAEAVAGDGPRRGSGREAGVRAPCRARAGGRAWPPFRALAGGHRVRAGGGGGGGGRSQRRPVRYGGG